MRQYTMAQLLGRRVLKELPASRRTKRDGTEREPKQLGRVHQVVFAPNGRRVIGITIKRPDVAGMVRRDDVFCLLDALTELDAKTLLVPDDPTVYDKAAIKRLGVDWERCIIWGGMDVRTESGQNLGFVSDVRFDADSGEVHFLAVGRGGFDEGLVGVLQIPSGMYRGYADGFLVVDDRAAKLALSGGLAARAGEASGRLKEGGREAAKKAGEAYERGTRQVGVLAGKAKKAFREMTQDEASPKELPAQDVRVQTTGAPAQPKPTVAPGTTYAPTGQQVQSAAPAKEPQGAAEKAAREIGKQVSRTKGMFQAFLDEFNESSK